MILKFEGSKYAGQINISQRQAVSKDVTEKKVKRKFANRLYMSWIWSVFVWDTKQVAPQYDSASTEVLH